MNTECKPKQFEFHALGRREVVGRFDGGRISSDGGGLLLREVDARIGMMRRLADYVRVVDAYDQDAIGRFGNYYLENPSAPEQVRAAVSHLTWTSPVTRDLLEVYREALGR